jgi:hypothetical protein
MTKQNDFIHLDTLFPRPESFFVDDSLQLYEISVLLLGRKPIIFRPLSFAMVLRLVEDRKGESLPAPDGRGAARHFADAACHSETGQVEGDDRRGFAGAGHE